MTEDQYQEELLALNTAHAQNEVARDGFLALAHTAIFAASISFIGNVVSLKTALLVPFLIVGWCSSVVGLLTLTWSFSATRKHIDDRRRNINDDDPPEPKFASKLNDIALWSFPVTILCLFTFVVSNVMVPMIKPPPASRPKIINEGTLPPPRAPSLKQQGGVTPPPRAPDHVSGKPAQTPPSPPKKT